MHEKYGAIRDALNQLVTEKNVQSRAQKTMRGQEMLLPRLK